MRSTRRMLTAMVVLSVLLLGTGLMEVSGGREAIQQATPAIPPPPAPLYLPLMMRNYNPEQLTWSIETVDSEGDVGQYTSLALDSAGNPHISYYDPTNRDVMFAGWTGSSWVTETVASAGHYWNGPCYTSLALDTADKAHIAYSNAYNCGEPSYMTCVNYTRWTGSSWITETVAGSPFDIGLYTSLALDRSDRPHITYSGWAPHWCGLAYHWWTGTEWSRRGFHTDPPHGSRGHASAALDSSDTPHISHLYSEYYSVFPGYLEYVRWTGSGWVTQIVDMDTDVRFYPLYTSLALDSLDNPHISYHWTDNSWGLGKGDLRYARWTGSKWVTQTVDSEGLVGHVGQYTSLALDSSDKPHISYYDSINGSLKYAWWTGSTWLIQTVDSEGDAGTYTSLAVDGAGNPHISYYDSTNGDLKYAKGQR